MTTEYFYSPDGLRVKETVDDGSAVTTKEYLFDARNHTGYAQVLEEYVNDQLNRTYTLGHDVITQNDSANGTLTFMYDGHGSTRALLDAAAGVVQRYDYDAYGNLLNSAFTPITDLLYCGEFFDATTGLQYLRARYYNPNTGRFNRSDPFIGNISDPASLHKYVYANTSPVMGIDPSGMFTLTLADVMSSISIMTILSAGARATFAAILNYAVQSRLIEILMPLRHELELMANVLQPLNARGADTISRMADGIGETLDNQSWMSGAAIVMSSFSTILGLGFTVIRVAPSAGTLVDVYYSVLEGISYQTAHSSLAASGSMSISNLHKIWTGELNLAEDLHAVTKFLMYSKSFRLKLAAKQLKNVGGRLGQYGVFDAECGYSRHGSIGPFSAGPIGLDPYHAGIWLNGWCHASPGILKYGGSLFAYMVS
jgi:RHS repeat-associated protein